MLENMLYKRFIYNSLRILSCFVLVVPNVVVATNGQLGDGLEVFLLALAEFIFGPLLVFLLAVAFIAFVWGVLKYFIFTVEGDRAPAKSLIVWGIGGFVLILTLFGIVNLLVDFLGLGEDTLRYLPSFPG